MFQKQSAFCTTPWTIVIAAQQEVVPDLVRAHIEALCSLYWPAVYAYLRRTGLNEHSATEVTQAFFSDVVLKRKLFLRAERRRGRMRSWLLKSLRNFQIDLSRKSQRSVVTFSIQDDDIATLESTLDVASELDPIQTFDRQWAVQVIEESLRRTEQHFIKTNQADKWQAFEVMVLTPLRSGNRPPRQLLLAEALGMDSAGTVASAAYSVRQHLRLRVETLIAETSAPDQRRGELDYLLSQLRAGQ